MSTYHVTWSMDIDADTPVEAARTALEIHRDPSSIATEFVIRHGGVKYVVDLHQGTVNGIDITDQEA